MRNWPVRWCQSCRPPGRIGEEYYPGTLRVCIKLFPMDIKRLWEYAPQAIYRAVVLGLVGAILTGFIVAYANGVDGREGVRNPLAQQDWTLQADDGTPRARASWQARVANPSELYGGADGVSFGRDRNRAIGNAVAPPVAEWIGQRLMLAVLSRKDGE